MISTAVGVVALGGVGLFLSAFFSGSETGFYRVARVRLMLDALGGDRVARILLWLTHRPSLFVATALVGNNLANYMTSLAIVIGAQALMGSDGHAAELIAPLLLAPVLFVYGELLPKNLFLKAPNRILRKGGPLFSVFLVLFFPVSILLWGVNRLLARIAVETPEQVRSTLAGRELQRILEEGHEAGILHGAQQDLARAIFAIAKKPIGAFASAVDAVPRARGDMTREEILQIARRFRAPAVVVEAADGETAGYVRVIDLGLTSGDPADALRPLLEIAETETYLGALVRMQSANESMGRVVDDEGRTVGMLTPEHLREPLFRGAR